MVPAVAAAAASGVASPAVHYFVPARASPGPFSCVKCCPQLRRTSLAAQRSVTTRVALNDVAVKPVKEEKEEKEEDEEQRKAAFTPTESGPEPPNAFEVQSLLMELCDETSIAELSVKVGSFELHVKRDVHGKGASSPPPIYIPPVPSVPMAEAFASSGPPAPPPRAAEPVEEEVDEGLLYISSPTVGILRRGRIYKGKRGRNLTEVGAEVKAGQVVCYIEQLSTQVAVESEHAGEVVSILADEGVAVGFGDPIVALRPSFPGIKKLTRA